MQEIIRVYSERGKLLEFKENKLSHQEMREEFFRTGKVSKRHKHCKVQLMTSDGKLILQKRSKWKGDNPGLWDKSVGGHLFKNESFNFSMVRECAEELQIPSTVVNRKGLKDILQLIDLKIIAMLFRLEINKNEVSERIEKNGKVWKEPGITAYYLGYYDGHIKFKPKESSAFGVFSLEEIEKEIKASPNSFTNDMRYILKRWKHLIKPLRKLK